MAPTPDGFVGCIRYSQVAARTWGKSNGLLSLGSEGLFWSACTFGNENDCSLVAITLYGGGVPMDAASPS